MYEILYRFYKKPATCLLLVLMVITPLCLFGQTNRIDSLNKILNTSRGLGKIDVQIELARENYFIDANLALDYINKALENAERANDSYRILKSSRLKGQVLRRLERLDDAIKVYESAYNMFKDSVGKASEIDEEFVNVLNSLGLAYTLVANYDKALDLHFHALVFREKKGDLANVSITYLNIGFVYFKLKNYEESLEYYKKSLEAKTVARDSFDLDRLYINMGLCYVHLKDFDKALETFNAGFKVCGDKCSDEILMEGEGSIGVAYYWLGNYDEAQKHLISGRNRAIKMGNQRFQVELLVYLARIALKTGELEKASDHLAECEKISNEIGYSQLLMDIYKEYANLYMQSNDFQQTAIYQNKYIVLKDKLIGEELVKNIGRIQAKFEERENLNTIRLRDDTIRLKDQAIKQQRYLNVSFGVIALLAGLVVFMLYRGYAVSRKVNAQLSEAKAIITDQRNRLDAKVKDVNAELDNFIYKISHDIRGPLASLKGICNVALMDVRDPLALDYLNKLDMSSAMLNVILTRLMIVNHINHATLDIKPIDFNAIIDEIVLLERKKGLPERFEIHRDIDTSVNFHSDHDIVKIILENLIDNSIKFYNESKRITPFARVTVKKLPTGEVLISVVDNGIGILEVRPNQIFQMFSRASERSGTGGIGLYLCKLGTDRLGGRINLRTTPEGHTEFYAVFPTENPVSA